MLDLIDKTIIYGGFSDIIETFTLTALETVKSLKFHQKVNQDVFYQREHFQVNDIICSLLVSYIKLACIH